MITEELVIPKRPTEEEIPTYKEISKVLEWCKAKDLYNTKVFINLLVKTDNKKDKVYEVAIWNKFKEKGSLKRIEFIRILRSYLGEPKDLARSPYHEFLTWQVLRQASDVEL